MNPWRVARLVAAVSCAAHGLAAPIVAQSVADAYASEAARELVRLARVHRSTVDRRIESYETTARERFTVSLRAGMIERTVYRRESAVRIDWRRDGAVHLDILGMREHVPIAKPDAEVPFDVSAEIAMLAFDPADPDMLVRIDTTEIRHPLMNGSERHYRFATGDTTVIVLPDGQTIRLRELRVIPRLRSPLLFTGSLWLEAESHAVVQVQMKLARAFDADRDMTVERTPESGFLETFLANQLLGLVKPLRFDVDFVAIDYGLWNLEWWLPRIAVARGVAQIGRFEVPVAYERTYSDYIIRGDTAEATRFAEGSDSTRGPCVRTVRFVAPGDSTMPDTLRQGRADREAARRARVRRDTLSVPCPREYVMTAPADSALLHSTDLPAEIDAPAFTLVTEAELEQITDRINSLAQPPWRFGRPVLQLGFQGPGLTRYNKVEGLSTGARLLLEAGSLRVTAEARYGFADHEIRGGAGVEHAGTTVDWDLGVYRRLAATSPSPNLHGIASSFSALAFGREEQEWLDARGAELVLRPAAIRAPWFQARLYAERQSAVERNTNFSVPHLFDTDRTFRDNFAADRANQVGAQLRFAATIGAPTGPRIDSELGFGAETGDYRFNRRDALVRAVLPLPWHLSLGAEVAAGVIEGDTAPAQALWRLGGPSSLRGYATASLIGERFWRTRTELGFDAGTTRISIFHDAAKAGRRALFGSTDAQASFGIGLTQLGGLIRLDLARPIHGPRDWRLHLFVNRPF